MTDPFMADSHPPCLVNISSGMLASEDVQKSLLSAINDSFNMSVNFISNALTETSGGSFYQKIPRSNIKTFTSMTCKVSIRNGKGFQMSGFVSPEILFRRALVLSSTRNDVSLETVLSHPIGPLPVSLFHEDGSLRKTTKSDLAAQLEFNADIINALPVFEGPKSLIRDAMSVIQSIDAKQFRTFYDLASSYMASLLSCFRQTDIVTDVFDRYDIESIKSLERQLRSKNAQSTQIYQVVGNRPIPDWRKFLAVGDNKTSLIRFLGEHIRKSMAENTQLDDRKALFVAGAYENPENVMKFSVEGESLCHELASNQEEADTRMIIHVMFSDLLFKERGEDGRIVVKSSDTDVMVLCCHFFCNLKNTKELWVYKGNSSYVRDGRKFVPIHEISQKLPSAFLRILPVAHALTGCDTVSSLYGVGKKTVYKLLRNAFDEFESIAELHDEVITDACSRACRAFVSRLYDGQSKFKECHQDLNTLRYKLATLKESCLARLPPCEAAFKEHFERTRLQSFIWLNANIPMTPPSSPENHGWSMQNGCWKPVPFQCTTSSEVLGELVCACKGKNKCSKDCLCSSRSLPCTVLCVCGGEDMCCNENTCLLHSRVDVVTVEEKDIIE